MTVFKTFWKAVFKYKGTIILYTILLIVFGGINMTTSEKQMTFENVKPDIFIINEDDEIGITKNLIDYISTNSNIIQLEEDEEKVNDALFYRDVNYIICIPQNYRKDVLDGKNPEIDIKKTGDYNSSLAEMMLSRYVKIQNIYASSIKNESELIEAINNNLSKKSNIEIISKLDTEKTSNATFYYNFASYSIMAIVIFVICLVLSSFYDKTVNKRTIISSMSYKKYNRQLLVASLVYAIIVWILFNILGLILVGNIMLSSRGLMYMLNSLVFTIVSITIALLISTLVRSKNAVNGIVNVVALGSAFLCGAFVPAEWLPESVLKIAHILPSYWYINSNELLKVMEEINLETLKPIFINMMVLIGFAFVFIIVNNIVYKRKQKIG